MPREMTPADVREQEQRTTETERKLVKMARHVLYQSAGPGTVVNLDHLRLRIAGGAKDSRSYFTWARILIRGWKHHGLPLAVLGSALGMTSEEVEASDHEPLFGHVTDAQLARALGYNVPTLAQDAPVTDDYDRRMVEQFAASLELRPRGDGSWSYQP